MPKLNTEAKILSIDIENSPVRGWVWGLWDNNLGLDQIDQDWFMLSWSAKWLGDKEVIYDALPFYPAYYKQFPTDDYNITLSIRNLLDEADIVVAHNGNKFDIPKIYAKCLEHGIPPPSPFRKVDTLVEAKKHFRLTSNKLDYIANLLGFGRKIKTDFRLWIDCMNGDKKAWDRMVKYNIKDVILLEKVYLKMRPWMVNHPNVGVYQDAGDKIVCPKCGSNHLQRRGFVYTSLSKFQRFQCTTCGGWSRGRTNLADRKKLIGNA